MLGETLIQDQQTLAPAARANDRVLGVVDECVEVADNQGTHIRNQQHQHKGRHIQQYNHMTDCRWEAGLKLDISEFHGSIRGEDLLDWIITVEEVLEFKQVPPYKQVELVATRF